MFISIGIWQNHYLKKAIDKGQGEFTLEDLRHVCSKGEQQQLFL